MLWPILLWLIYLLIADRIQYCTKFVVIFVIKSIKDFSSARLAMDATVIQDLPSDMNCQSLLENYNIWQSCKLQNTALIYIFFWFVPWG